MRSLLRNWLAPDIFWPIVVIALTVVLLAALLAGVVG